MRFCKFDFCKERLLQIQVKAEEPVNFFMLLREV